MDWLDRHERFINWAWLLGWGLASSIWCLTAAQQLGATFDEPLYITRGLEGWRAFSHQGLMRKGTMPLAIDVQTLPLYLYERITGTTFDPNADMEQILPAARAGTLFFWWLMLFYGFRSGRQIGGVWGGRLAVAFLASEPTLLAHAGLATTDIAAAACLLAFAFHFQQGRRTTPLSPVLGGEGLIRCGWLKRVGVPGLWFGLALLAKASALAFGPLCVVAIEGTRRLRFSQIGLAAAPFALFPRPALRRDALQIGLLGLAVTFIYCGSDWQAEPSFRRWAQQMADDPSQLDPASQWVHVRLQSWNNLVDEPGAGERGLIWLSEHLRIFSNAGEGIIRQIAHNSRGHDGSFLLGEARPKGAFWYYFPLALTIKLSLPLLLLLPLLACLRLRVLGNWALVAALFLLLFSLTARIQIGIRLILPLVVLAIVGLAGSAACLQRALSVVRKQPAPRWLQYTGFPGILVFGVIWTSVSAVWVWPQGLCYTNEIWGDTEKGYKYLSDSNYDWGQGLKELAAWQKEHDNAKVDVWYFGSDPLVDKLPIHHMPLHVLPIAKPEDVFPLVDGDYVAVSTTLLYGMAADTPAHRMASEFFLRHRPAYRTTTFLIYDFTERKSAASYQ
ncbi:MAG: hypothetical protein ACJ8FY_28910 [Gemmataceae bacterium]